MAEDDGPRERRHFTAEFKLEVVRRVAERNVAPSADVFPLRGRPPA